MTRSAHLIIDKEAYIVVTETMYGAHGLPKDATNIINELQQVIHCIGKTVI